MIKHFLLSLLFVVSLGVAAKDLVVEIPEEWCKGSILIKPKTLNPDPIPEPRPHPIDRPLFSNKPVGKTYIHEVPKAGEFSYRQLDSQPSAVHAFKFKTPDTSKPTVFKVAAARTSDSDTTGLLLEISWKPSGPTITNCSNFDPEAVGLSYYINIRPIKTYQACILKPGTLYYANVYQRRHRLHAEMTCTSNCSFLFQKI